MPNQTRPLTQTTNRGFENEMPHEYFVEKGIAQNKPTDVDLQETIWNFLEAVPGLELSEIEVDCQNGVVTLMGTFTDSQMQGKIIHNIMHMNGVKSVRDETHLLSKHQMMNSPGV